MSSAALECPRLPDRPASPTRSGFWSRYGVVSCAAATTAVGYAWIAGLQAQGRSAAALDMPDMVMTDVGRYWAFPLLQSSGLTGLVFAYLSVLLGLRGARRSIHGQTGLAVVGLVLVHVVATAFDGMDMNWRSVLIPGYLATHGWPSATWGFDTGIFALYALLLLAPTFYGRRLIGVRRWRFLHRFVLGFYFLSVWHALILGLDVSYYAWVRPAIWLAQIPLIAALIARVRHTPNPKQSPGQRYPMSYARYAIIAACGGAIAAVLLIVTTGNSGFIHTV